MPLSASMVSKPRMPRPPSRPFVMRKTVLQAQLPDAPLMPPTMHIFLKTMRPSPNTTTYLMPLPGTPLTPRWLQPRWPESLRKGSNTSSAKQALSLATVTVVLRNKLLWGETTWGEARGRQALRRPKPSMKSRHAVRAKVARVNQSCAFTIETEHPLQSTGLR